MATFKCTKCDNIKEFLKQLYELKVEKCANCNNVGTWAVYTGPMATTILDREDVRSVKLNEELAAAKIEYQRLKRELEVITSALKRKEHSYESNCGTMGITEIKKSVKEIEQIMDDMLQITREYNEAERKYLPLKEDVENLGNRKAVRKDVPVAFQSAANTEQKSGKNKLYIGNRQYVSRHGDGSLSKKARLLDVPNWSPGLNVAWVEGGISAKAHFKLKLNAGDPYADIPGAVLQKFAEKPDYDADEFFKLCKADGKGSLLWYDKDGKNRPTWTALEIWVLLRAGYRFTFANSKHDGVGRKIVLVPPPG
jgi:hypothetical protein